jgi:uncharacterized membrane protein YfcA
MLRLPLVALAGVLSGAMNAIAGGGSFVSLPALIAAGLPSVAANATSTVALLPGGLASVWVYRRGLEPVGAASLPAMAVATLAGAVLGSLLLLSTPSHAFDDVLPWLLLAATVTLAGGPALSRRLAHRRAGAPPHPAPLLAAQFGLGIYGGYFGGAVGIMMMAAWSLLADAVDLRRLQSARTLLVCAANAVAVAIFAVSGVVGWAEALALGAGGLAGGYAGARIASRLPARWLRAATIALCGAVTLLFFLRSLAR